MQITADLTEAITGNFFFIKEGRENEMMHLAESVASLALWEGGEHVCPCHSVLTEVGSPGTELEFAL